MAAAKTRVARGIDDTNCSGAKERTTMVFLAQQYLHNDIRWRTGRERAPNSAEQKSGEGTWPRTETRVEESDKYAVPA